MTEHLNKDRPPWTGWLRFGIFVLGTVPLICGVNFLLEWIDHPHKWSYPRMAFWLSLLLQWGGLAMLTFSILGWSAYIERLRMVGKLTDTNPADSPTRST